MYCYIHYHERIGTEIRSERFYITYDIKNIICKNNSKTNRLLIICKEKSYLK